MKYAPAIAACATTGVVVLAGLIITKDSVCILGLLGMVIAVWLMPKA